MVHLKDEGSHFDVPIEVVWKFVQSPDAHGLSHKSARNQRMKPLGENTMLVTFEQNLNGTWVRVANRITVVPPLGMAIEVIEGPMAGSKMFNVYTPKGAKTGVDVYGEFVSSQIPPAQLEAAVRAFLETVFTEDSAALTAFGARKEGAEPPSSGGRSMAAGEGVGPGGSPRLGSVPRRDAARRNPRE